MRGLVILLVVVFIVVLGLAAVAAPEPVKVRCGYVGEQTTFKGKTATCMANGEWR